MFILQYWGYSLKPIYFYSGAFKFMQWTCLFSFLISKLNCTITHYLLVMSFKSRVIEIWRWHSLSYSFVIIYMIDADTFSKHSNLKLIEIAWTTLYTDWCIFFCRHLKLHKLCCVFVFMYVSYVSFIQLRLQVIYIVYVYHCHSLILRIWSFFCTKDAVFTYLSHDLSINHLISISVIFFFYICGHLVIYGIGLKKSDHDKFRMNKKMQLKFISVDFQLILM